MTNEDYYNIFDQMIEELQTDNRDDLTKVTNSIMNFKIRIDQERVIRAEPYERNSERSEQRNGNKDKTFRTRMGDIPVEVSQDRGMEFNPSSIEKGCRSERALKLVIVLMYIQGVSTRRV